MRQSIINTAKLLSVDPTWLENIIRFESSNNPLAKNKYTGARGLIQFLHSTAKGLGFKDADDLVNRYPDYDSQVSGPVYAYLKRYIPFPTKQSLYMSVFYPAARSWNLNKQFPDSVQKVNPNIKTVKDYVDKVDRTLLKNVETYGAAGLILALLFVVYITKMR